MTRKTITVTEDVYERLATLKRDDESWSELGDRAADVLESGDSDVNTEPSSVVVENIDEIARASADEVEDRMTRR